MQSLEEKVIKRNQNNKRSTARRFGFGLLALLVLLGTAVSLLLPAFTLEKDTFCGLEEHTHTEDCYRVDYICGEEERPAHLHSDDCYTVERTLICELPEGEGHTHDETCIGQVTELSCGLEEDEGHIHDESCYAEDWVLTCDVWDEDHVHDDACYTIELVLICGEDERPAHLHDESCYTTSEAYICGQEEYEGHTHTDDCYLETRELSCGLEEDEGHTHTDACQVKELICEKEEHVHTLQCYSDPNADIENEYDWLRSFPTFAEDTPRLTRLLEIAVSQLGYHESAVNYLVDEYELAHGYTRYGAFYGDPYADWNAMFVSFCLYYAEIDAEVFPAVGDAQNMIGMLDSCGLYAAAATGAMPRPGDLVFLETAGTDLVRVGIVSAVDAERGLLTVIEGDSADGVDECRYALSDAAVLGYGVMPELLRAELFTDEAEPAENADDTAAADTTTDDTATDDTATDDTAADETNTDDTTAAESENDNNNDAADADSATAGETVLAEGAETASDASKPQLTEAAEKATESEDTSATTLPNLDLGMAVVEAINGETLPAEASGYAYALEGEDAAAAQAQVEAWLGLDAAMPMKLEAPRMAMSAPAALPMGESEASEAQPADEDTAAEDESTATEETRYEVYEIGLENVDAEDYADGFRVTVTLPEPLTGRDFRLYHLAGDGVEELALESESVENEDGTVTVSGFSFVTYSFSPFVLRYTVDFEYSVNGEMYAFSLPGGEKIALSDLIEVLGVCEGTKFEDASEFIEAVEKVEFSDPTLLAVTQVTDEMTYAQIDAQVFDVVFDGAEIEPDNKLVSGPDWILTSLAPFKTKEVLSVTMKNGDVITVKVTDAQEVAGNNYITDAQLEIDGKTYGKDETWKVYEDVDYTLKLSFAEKGSRQFPKGGDTIVIDLPAGLTLAEDGHHTFSIPAGLAGTITGNEYWVENGKLYVKFGDDPDDILTRSSNAHFDLSFTAQFKEGTNELDFNDRVKPEVDVDNEGSVSVNKSASYNSATGKMEYTVVVKSTGNSENVSVHDALANTNLLTIDTSSITVEPSSTNYSLSNQSTSGFDMTIPKMGHNETVTIKYVADVNTSALDHKGNIKVSDDGKNTVTVYNDDHNRDSDTNTYTNQIKYSSTDKRSTTAVDNEESDENNKTATLGWKITLNDNYRGSIVGDKVTDTIDWSSREAMKYTVDENGKFYIDIVAKSEDGSKTYKREKVEVTVTTNDQGVQSWEYEIPKFESDDEILSYEITYTTEVDKTKLSPDSQGMVKNNTNNEGDGSDSGTGVVPGYNPGGGSPGGEDEITGGKKAVAVTPEYIDWDIVVVIPPEGFPDGFVITDEIPNGADLGQKFADTFDSIVSVEGLINNEDYSYEVTKEDHNNLSPKQKDILTITFYQDKAKTDSGLDSSDGTRTLTVTIRTKNDPDWVNFADTAGGGEQAIYHTNKVKFNDGSWHTDKAAPLHTMIDKEKESTLSPYNDNGVELPQYEYSVVLTNVTKLPVVITDTYNPDELVFVTGGQVGWPGHDGIAASSQKNQLNNPDNSYLATFSADTETGTLTITAGSLPTKDDGSFFEFYKIYYTMRVKDKDALDSFTQKAIANGGTYQVGNTASWNGVDDHVDIDFTVPALEKTGKFRDSGNNRLYDFVIDINKNAIELNGGEPMDLTDTHTDNLTVDYTTIKVYKYDKDGNRTLDTSIDWNFDGNMGTFYNLEDSTHYAIEYSCLVIGSGTQSFENYAEMGGFHAEKHDSRYFDTDSSAGASVFQIGFIKYQNGMTSNGLAGATFQLFRGTGNYTWVTEGEYTWGVEEKEPMTWGDTTETRNNNIVGQPITFTTNADGYVQIALDQTRHGAELEEGVHYYLKEIESPPGYQIDSSVEYWEFTLTMDPDEVDYGKTRNEYNNRNWIYFYYDDILKMNNTKTEEPLTVKVDKEWFDINGNKVENPQNVSAEIQLYQKKNNEEYKAVTTITGKSGTVYNGKITLPINGSWEYTWEALPRVDDEGNDYAYKLEEGTITAPDGDIYVSSSSLDEDEDEKSYHFQNYKVQERKVNVSVSKSWMTEDGVTPLTENLPDSISFYLYRVVSRVPFTTTPTSGGNAYKITGNSYLKTDDGGDPYYEIQKADFSGVTFENLPSVEKVHNDSTGEDEWYFYSYYVKEIPLARYDSSVKVSDETDATNNNIIINAVTNTKLPEPTDLNVSKVWKDENGEEITDNNKTPDSIQFKLYQVKSSKPFTEQPTSGGSLYTVSSHGRAVWIDGKQVAGTYKLEKWNGGWSTSFENLPAYSFDEKTGKVTYYAYYVKEDRIEGYKGTVGVTKNEDGYAITLTNQVRSDTTDITVDKKWVNGDFSTSWPEGINSVTVKIQQSGDNGTTWQDISVANGNIPAYYWDSETNQIKTGEDGSTWSDTTNLTNDATSHTWSHLDAWYLDTNDDEQDYIYRFVETKVNDVAVVDGQVTVNGVTYEVNGGAVSDNNASITNSERTDIKFEKKWQNISGTVTWTVPDTATYYTFSADSAHSNTVTATSGTESNSQLRQNGSAVSNEEINFDFNKLRLIVELKRYAYIDGVKTAVPFDLTNEHEARIAGAKTLYGEENDSWGSPTSGHWADEFVETGFWTGEWKDLPTAGEDENGNAINYIYEVKELAVIPSRQELTDVGYHYIDISDMFDTSTSTAADGTKIITNKMKGDNNYYLNVSKEWRDYEGKPTTGEAVEFQLIRSGSRTTIGSGSSAAGSPATISVVNMYNSSESNSWTEYTTPANTKIKVGDTVKIYWHSYYSSGSTQGVDDFSATSYDNNNGYILQFKVTATNAQLQANRNMPGEGYPIIVERVQEYEPSSTTEEIAGQVMKPDGNGGYEVDTTGNYKFTIQPGQTVSFANLPYNVATGTTTTETYTYTVVETSTGSSWHVVTGQGTYNPAPAAGEEGGQNGEVKLVNQYDQPQTGSVKVTKSFSGIDALPDTFQISAKYGDPEQTITLQTTGKQPEHVTLTGTGTSEAPYTWEISDLPIGTVVTFTESGYDAEGYEVSVTVNGTAVAENEKAKGTAKPTDGTPVAFTNTYTPKKTSFDFYKVWLDPDGVVENPETYQEWKQDITVTIKRKATGSGDEDKDFALVYTITNPKSGDSFTPINGSTIPEEERDNFKLTVIADSTDKLFHFALPEDSLDAYDVDGTEWVYSVVEETVSPYVPKYGEKSGGTWALGEDKQCAYEGELIINQTFYGYELPSTGGIGAEAYRLSGAALLLASGSLAAARKRTRGKAARRKGGDIPT